MLSSFVVNSYFISSFPSWQSRLFAHPSQPQAIKPSLLCELVHLLCNSSHKFGDTHNRYKVPCCGDATSHGTGQLRAEWPEAELWNTTDMWKYDWAEPAHGPCWNCPTSPDLPSLHRAPTEFHILPASCVRKAWDTLPLQFIAFLRWVCFTILLMFSCLIWEYTSEQWKCSPFGHQSKAISSLLFISQRGMPM